uniref:Bacteriophage T5 Orf172 DNA-binding domain-containing protein n=1 Tax=Pyramimonas orientalis virus TaxID=455367 RepID=A0A7L9AYW5_POV01|nr:hypothetical protein HWQ62_00324 [Pyramimonas orientalis virus]
MFGYIYLLQTRESYRNNETIYKIGRTEQDSLTRFNTYPNGSKIFLHMYCLDSITLERQLINIFNTKYKNIHLYGREYFDGSLHDMLNTIMNHIGYTCNYDESITRYHTKLQTCLNKENSLLEEIRTLKHKLKIQHEEMNTLYVDESNITYNGIANTQEKNDKTCSKCKKIFTRKDHMKVHEKKCDGFDKKQCKICLRMFTTHQAKWKHKTHVKCNPPS